MIFALWSLPGSKKVFLDAFGLAPNTTEGEFVEWLILIPKSTKKFMNLHFLALWAYARQAGAE